MNLGQWTDIAVVVAATAHTLDKLVIWAQAFLAKEEPVVSKALAHVETILEAVPSPDASSDTPVSTPVAPAPTSEPSATPSAPTETTAPTASSTPVPAPAPEVVEAPKSVVAAVAPETPDQRAEAEVGHPDQNYTDLCLKFVRTMFGLPANGSNPTAVSTWDNCPEAQRHPFSDHMPANVPVVWSGGSHGAGHIAVSVGDGNIVSTDISGDGTVSIVKASLIAQKWGLHPLGWIAELEGKRLWTEEYGH
jgi:hypothetical protein